MICHKASMGVSGLDAAVLILMLCRRAAEPARLQSAALRAATAIQVVRHTLAAPLEGHAGTGQKTGTRHTSPYNSGNPPALHL